MITIEEAQDIPGVKDIDIENCKEIGDDGKTLVNEDCVRAAIAARECETLLVSSLEEIDPPEPPTTFPKPN